MIKSISTETFRKFTGVNIATVIPAGVNPRLIDRIEVAVTPLTDLLNKVPEEFHHIGSLGQSDALATYFAVCEGSEVLLSPAPRFHQGSNYAHEGTVEKDGISLGTAWNSRLGDIRYVVEYKSEFKNWSGSDFLDETTVILHLVRPIEDQPLIAKIRRRVEETLRQGSATQIIQIAAQLGVNFN